MVYLLDHFRWNWIGVIVTNDDHGIQFLSELRGEMQNNIVCLSVAIITKTENFMAFKL
jgi:hypothetical protein